MWCMRRSPSLGLGLTPRSLGRSLSGNTRVRFGFSCLANFGWGQNSPNTLRPLPRKNSLKLFFFYIGGGEKFIKGVFARFRPPQPPEEFHRRKAGGWEAESFLVAEVVGKSPPTQSSLCARGSSAFGVFACLCSKPAFSP